MTGLGLSGISCSDCSGRYDPWCTGPFPSSIVALEARGGQFSDCILTLTGLRGAPCSRPELGMGIAGNAFHPTFSICSPLIPMRGDPSFIIGRGFSETDAGEDGADMMLV
jgi:hypothetical protein